MAESAGIPSTTNNNKPIGQSTLDLTNFSLPPISTPAIQTPIKNTTIDLNNFSLPTVTTPVTPVTPVVETPIKNTTIDLNSFSLPVTKPTVPTATTPITPAAQTPIKNTTIDLNSFSLPATKPTVPTATTPVTPAVQTPIKNTTVDLNSFSLPVTKPTVPTATKPTVPTATTPVTPTATTPATPSTPAVQTSTKDTKSSLGGFSFSGFIKKAIQSVVKPTVSTPAAETKPSTPTPSTATKPSTPIAPTPSLQISTNSTPVAAKNPSPQGKSAIDITRIPNNSDLNLGSLNIATKIESKDDKLRTNALLASGIREEPKKEKKGFALSNVQIIVAGYAIILITILGSIGVQMYSNYISLQNQVPKDETKASFIENGQNIELFISKYGQVNDFALRADKTSLLTTNPEKDTIANSIKNDTRLSFTQKRIVLQNNINALNTEIVNNNRKLEDTKLEIEKYGFIPKELYDMTQKEEGINNIRRSMLLKENIKFITAFKVFGYMQSFIQGFANDSSIDAKKIEEQLKSLNENGEKDIITYTNNCYFNPYEIGDDCGITKEFDTYYKIINTKSNVDPDFIKKIASYADRKLNEKELPNYTITFPEFNPKQEEIKFTTDINTNRQDELALNKIGIINPHLYIITNLLNTLKQSLLVIGEDIKVDQIKISPKTVRIGSTIFTINNSTLNFNLPIQKPDQREISDFFSNQSSN